VKSERDEGLEPPRLVLELSKAQQVVGPVLESLDVAVEHGRIRSHAEAVSDAMHFEVLIGGRLVVRNAGPHFWVKDLGAAPGKAIEPAARKRARTCKCVMP
jgi:hypothetical protein